MIRFIKRICLLGMLIISVTISAYATQGDLQTSAGDTVAVGACSLDPLTSTQVSNSAASFTAQWTPNQHTVTYLCGTGAGGTPPTPQSINFDATFTVKNTTGANCTKSGYGFASWACKYLNGANNTPSTALNNNAKYTIDKDAQCTATWKGNVITLNWNTGGHPNAYSDIPAEYQPVEYVQSSGTQYIDTGVKPDNTMKVEIKFKPTNNTSTYCLFGGRDSLSGDRKSFAVWSSINNSAGKPRFDFGSTSASATSATSTTNWNIVIKDGASNTFNGMLTNNATATFETNYNAYLFAMNTGNSVASNMAGQVAYCTIWKSGAIIRNLVPVRRKADNVVGMYDTVSGAFFGNGGTGTLTAGNDIDIVAPDSCIYGSTFTMPVALLDTGYTFNKWNVNNKTFDAEQTEVACNYTNLGVYSGSATITASWTAHTIDLTWNKLAGDATPHATNTCTYDGDITLPTEPSRTGFSFMGWTLDNE